MMGNWCNIGDHGLEALSRSQALTDLTVYTATPLSDAALTGFGRCTRLKTLFLYQHWGRTVPDFRITGDGLAPLAACTQLERLHLELSHGEEGGEVFAVLQALPRLTSLTLRGGHLKDHFLALLGGLDNLEEINLIDAIITENGLAFLREHPALRRLQLTAASVGDDGLAHLATCGRLEDVFIGGARVTDAGVAAFLEVPGRNTLRHFSVWQSPQITDASLIRLAEHKELEGIGFGWSEHFTDEGIAALAGLPKLEWLSLNNAARLTNRTLDTLAGCPALREAYLGVMRKDGSFTADGIAQFKEAKPRAHLYVPPPREAAAAEPAPPPEPLEEVEEVF
jgi:hypothetical protein